VKLRPHLARYKSNSWFIRIGRTAYRLERATATGAEFLLNEDCASWHYDGRPLTRTEELSAWWRGFKSGWHDAGMDGHPWFAAGAEGCDAGRTANLESE
jgi:hypothetical protein